MKVVLIDDHSIFRLGLRSLLEAQAHIEIVGEAKDADEGVKVIRQTNPDVVVLDHAMPGPSGLELIAVLRHRYPELKFILLTASKSESVIFEALQSGAHGIILKQDTSDELVRAVRTVRRGKRVLSKGIAPLAKRVDSLSGLTKRERQVLRMIANGYRNREISEELNISMKTVDTHRTNLMRKLDLHSLAHVVEFANRVGLIDPSI